MEMFILYLTAVIISLAYLALGFGINKENAKYLLAGYNTMGEERRKKFNIDKYLAFFKLFFKRLAFFPVPSLLICIAAFEFNVAIVTWSLVQMLRFLFFAKRSIWNQWEL